MSELNESLQDIVNRNTFFDLPDTSTSPIKGGIITAVESVLKERALRHQRRGNDRLRIIVNIPPYYQSSDTSSDHDEYRNVRSVYAEFVDKVCKVALKYGTVCRGVPSTTYNYTRGDLVVDTDLESKPLKITLSVVGDSSLTPLLEGEINYADDLLAKEDPTPVVETKAKEAAPAQTGTTVSLLTTSPTPISDLMLDLLIRLSAKKQRAVLCRTFADATIESDYIVLPAEQSVISNIEMVDAHAVFWTGEGCVSKACLYTTDCEWMSLAYAISTVVPVTLPVNLDTGEPSDLTSRLVLKGLALAPDDVLDDVYEWCDAFSETKLPTGTEALEYMSRRRWNT